MTEAQINHSFLSCIDTTCSTRLSPFVYLLHIYVHQKFNDRIGIPIDKPAKLVAGRVKIEAKYPFL